MIDVQALTFAYGSAPAAVNQISFAVAPGEIFGLLGPSGAGKSTTQNILIGLLKGYRGDVRVFGRELVTWGNDYYEHIGVAFELPTHFRKLTALENLAYFRALYRRKALTPQDALACVGLADAANLRVEQFSKGMQNRLSVARALLHQPKLLFLDEPTSGLDPVNAQRICDLIRAQQARGATILLTTHNMHIAESLCDRVAFMVGGQIPLIDTPRALKLRFGKARVQVEYVEHANPQHASFALAGIGENARFLDVLRTGTVQTIHTQEATLDDVFVRVTGTPLQDETFANNL